MQKMTSAYANKMLRNLEEEKAYWLNKEAVSSTYVASTDEEPVIPEPDQFQETSSADVNYEPVSTESNEPLHQLLQKLTKKQL